MEEVWSNLGGMRPLMVIVAMFLFSAVLLAVRWVSYLFASRPLWVMQEWEKRLGNLWVAYNAGERPPYAHAILSTVLESTINDIFEKRAKYSRRKLDSFWIWVDEAIALEASLRSLMNEIRCRTHVANSVPFEDRWSYVLARFFSECGFAPNVVKRNESTLDVLNRGILLLGFIGLFVEVSGVLILTDPSDLYFSFTYALWMVRPFFSLLVSYSLYVILNVVSAQWSTHALIAETEKVFFHCLASGQDLQQAYGQSERLSA